MATYKLIQDIEADDKILGPLTLRQFIFALVTAFFGYLNFIFVVKHFYVLMIPFVPIMLGTGFFAFPFMGDQPTEIWALARLRFMFKPRKRMWDQSGVKELVTITVPKKIEKVYTDGLSQTEVKSRLKALASTIDSRGWATKNIDNYAPNPLIATSNERLLDISAVPDAVPDTIVPASQDMLDDQHNPIAKQFDTMIEKSTLDYRNRLIAEMNGSTTIQPPVQSAPASWFFMNGHGDATSNISTPSLQSSTDSGLISQLKPFSTRSNTSYGNLRTLKVLDNSQPQQATSDSRSLNQSITTVTTPSHPVILALAHNDDLSVSTIAREAKKVTGKSTGNEEVVISLH